MSETPRLASNNAEDVQLAAQWELDPRHVPTVANQVLIQHAMADSASGRPTGMYINLGHVSPPIFSSEMAQEQAAELGPLPVVVVGSFYMPLQSVIDLRNGLNDALAHIPGLS